MVYSIVSVPEVIKDIQKGIAWYNSLHNGMGNNFFFSIKLTYSLMQTESNKYIPDSDDLCCLDVQGFPYKIIYKVENEKQYVVVFGIFHTSHEQITSDMIE